MKKGFKFSETSRQKMRLSHLGKLHTKERRDKIKRIAIEKGFGKWMTGKKHSEESKKKIRIAHFGRKNSISHNLNISKGKKGKPNLNLRGEKHHNWKGGITTINHFIRTSLEYKLWRRSVFERDNYTCIWCRIRGNQTGGYLEADHIKPFALFPELRFSIDNGRTLCKECHKKTETFAGKGIPRK